MSGPSGATYPTYTLPTYNVKDNPSVFNFRGNTIPRLNYIRQVLLAISFNQDFLLRVLDFRNMGRAYYNSNPKRFCSTVQLKAVETFNGKHITVYLPSPGGRISNSIPYVKYNYVTKTPLMRVLQKQQLPTCWSNIVLGGTGECKQISTSPDEAQTKLTPNEQVLYYYIKNADIFTRLLKLLVSSFYDHAIRRFQCYTFTLPSDLYQGSHEERTFTVTGDFLRSIYSTFLRGQRIGSNLKLPAPLNLDPVYDLPTTDFTRIELTKQQNDDSNSFPI